MDQRLSPTFFPRQDVQNSDLNQIYAYDDAQFRAHNRTFHGCGVVCGLTVEPNLDRKSLTVSPGFAVSPQGDEIIVSTAVQVSLDCVELIEFDCEVLNPAAPQAGEFKPAYIVIRYTSEQGCFKPISPADCAPLDQCQPTRLIDSFEITCMTRKPESCVPRLNLVGCMPAEQLIRRLLTLGDLSETGLFCGVDTGEIWLTLARIDFERKPDRSIMPTVSYEDRTYLPSIQFLLDLTRRVGAQALKSQSKRKAITGIKDPGTTRLRINRGRYIPQIKIYGRELRHIDSVSFSDPHIQASLVNVPANDTEFAMSISTPLLTASNETSLIVKLRSGIIIDSARQTVPIIIELYDNPVEQIPAIQSLVPTLRTQVVGWFINEGYMTAQSVAHEMTDNLWQKYRQRPYNLPPAMIFRFLRSLIGSTQSWLKTGAPES